MENDTLIYVDGKPMMINIRHLSSYFWNLHRPSEEGPAVCYPDGREDYFEYGKLHRLNGPAIICPNGFKKWYVNGKLHRKDGPAIENASGYVEYWKDGKRVK